MLFICLQHFICNLKVTEHGYYGVEFFFVLSGVFIYKSFLKNNAKGTIQFTIDKIHKFFKQYVIALFCALIVGIGYDFISGHITSAYDYSLDKLLQIIADLTFAQNVGIWKGSGSLPIWYISVLVFGGGFLYSMLRTNKNYAVKIWFPAFFIIIYTYIFQHGNAHNIEIWTVTDHFFYIPLLRGMADMIIGILLYHFILNQYNELQTNKKYTNTLNILSLLSLILIIILIFTKQHHDEYIVLFAAVLLLGCFIPNGIFQKYINHKIWIFLGGITYEMLLVHNTLSLIMHQANKYFQLSGIILLPIYIILTILLSYLLKRLVNIK